MNFKHANTRATELRYSPTLELMMNECNLYLINKHAPQCFKSAHSFVLRLSASRRMRSDRPPPSTHWAVGKF